MPRQTIIVVASSLMRARFGRQPVILLKPVRWMCVSTATPPRQLQGVRLVPGDAVMFLDGWAEGPRAGAVTDALRQAGVDGPLPTEGTLTVGEELHTHAEPRCTITGIMRGQYYTDPGPGSGPFKGLSDEENRLYNDALERSDWLLCSILQKLAGERNARRRAEATLSQVQEAIAA